MGRGSHLHPQSATSLGHHRHFSVDVGLANGNGHFASPASLNGITSLRLTAREDSTRVQLQKQRLKEQHATAIISNTVPGFKTSAAFFASLRTNLRLHASPPPSPISTPPSMRGSATSLPPPSPLSGPVDSVMGDAEDVPQEDPLAGVPELRTVKTEDNEEKVAALKLVADSVAQMRQTANHSLTVNPVNLAVGVAILALVARYMVEAKHSTFLAGTTCAGIVMSMLAIFRWLTQDYLQGAEMINWAWLGDSDVLVTKFGDEVIGTAIIEWVSGESRQKRKKAWRGELRAWTVRLKYRKKGVGSALLEEAVKEAKKKGAETIEFADEHANSLRVLPGMYNSVFDKREQKARDLLADLLESSPGKGKRR